MAPSNIPPVAPTPAPPSGASGQVVQIVSLPDALQNNARAIRIEGEVVQQNKDGSVRVRTPQGDIDVAVRGRQPQEGQRLEVDIPAGSPPRNATIRPAPAQPQPQQPLPPANTTPPAETPVTLPPTRPLPAPVAPPAQGQTPAPLPSSGGTTQPFPPVTGQPAKPAVENPSLPPQGADTAIPVKQALPPLPALTAGATIKLVAQPDGQMPVPDAKGNMAPAAITKAETNAVLTAQKAQGNLVATLLQAVKSVLPDSLVPQTIGKTPSLTPVNTSPIAVPQNGATVPPLVLSAKIVSITLPSGQTLTAPAQQTQIAAVPPVATAIPASPAPATPQVVNPASLLTVTITEVTPQNQPIVPVPTNSTGTVQNFILQSPPATVPVGAQITLQPQIAIPTAMMTGDAALVPSMPTGVLAPSPLSALPPAWRAMLPLMQAAPLWPAMDELFQTFYQATPQAAQVLGRTIPSPANAANFGSAVLLFAAALKSGDLQGWMGDRKFEMLQKLGKDSILSRLSGETSSLAANNDSATTDWKSFPIPLLWQNEISKVMFHVRKEPSEDEQEKGQAGTRFVMDLSLTRMGDVQLDGLVRGKRLDLIVRTQTPVSSMMQEAMATAYANALDGTDIYGEIGFQSDRANWENILQRQDALTATV